MAPLPKKARRRIGSMLDTVVPETPDQINNDDGSDSEGSENNSINSETLISSLDDSDGDQTRNNDDDDATNVQAIVVGRGNAKMGFEWGTGKVMQLDMDANNHVVGSNAVAFSSQLGILAKDGNKLSLTYTDWRGVSSIQKDLVWTEIKENTNLQDSYKKNCMKKLGKLWKDWKSRLKAKFYTPHRHDKSFVLSKCPQRVEADQWPVLVNYWSSKNSKKLSKVNKNSRKHVKLPARLGRKDMANAIEECRKEFGKEPSKLDLFVYTRQPKNGKPLDKNTAEKIAILQDLKQKLPENLRDDVDANDGIYEEVVGTEAPGCLRSSIVVSKSKNVTFTTREEFDRAVQNKTNDMVASIRKNFEEEMSKFKEDYSSKMEMLQARLLSLEGHNGNESENLNSRRIQAFNIGPTSGGFINSENSSDATEHPKMGEETNNSDRNILFHGLCAQEQVKIATRTYNKRKTM